MSSEILTLLCYAAIAVLAVVLWQIYLGPIIAAFIAESRRRPVGSCHICYRRTEYKCARCRNWSCDEHVSWDEATGQNKELVCDACNTSVAPGGRTKLEWRNFLDQRFRQMAEPAAGVGDIIVRDLYVGPPSMRLGSDSCWPVGEPYRGRGIPHILMALVTEGGAPVDIEYLDYETAGYWPLRCNTAEPPVLFRRAAPRWVVSEYIERKREIIRKLRGGRITEAESDRLHRDNKALLLSQMYVPSQQELRNIIGF